MIIYFEIVDLTNKGEIKKKIIYKNNIDKKKIIDDEEILKNNKIIIDPINSDIVSFNSKKRYFNQEIYEYNNKTFELDKAQIKEE